MTASVLRANLCKDQMPFTRCAHAEVELNSAPNVRQLIFAAGIGSDVFWPPQRPTVRIECSVSLAHSARVLLAGQHGPELLLRLPI